jgi:hypothetical protein
VAPPGYTAVAASRDAERQPGDQDGATEIVVDTTTQVNMVDLASRWNGCHTLDAGFHKRRDRRRGNADLS